MKHLPTFKPVIRKDTQLLDGTSNVKIRICFAEKTRYISTDYYVIEKFFDVKDGKILPGAGRTKDQADRANNRIKIEIGILADKADRLRDRINSMDMSMLMAILRDKRKEYELLALMDDRISKYKKTGNVNYEGIFSRTKDIVKSFAGSEISLSSITPDWLRRLEIKMKLDGLAPNSIGIHMRNVRTCFNQAISMGIVPLNSYPFRGYRIPRAPTRKRNLSAEEIAKIYRAEISDPLMAWGRDMFMLSFFLIGINMKDLMFLKEIEEGRIYYIRSKGKKPYSIKVFPEAQEIIDRYPGKKYLLNTMDNYTDYRTATKRINYKLKDVAKICKITKGVSTYYCRHSWATIGRMIGISIDDISMSLGHSVPDPEKETTFRYLNDDDYNTFTDKANRCLIDYVLNILPSVQHPSPDNI